MTELKGEKAVPTGQVEGGASDTETLARELDVPRASVDRLSPPVPPPDTDRRWVRINLDGRMSDRFDRVRQVGYDLERLKSYTGLSRLTHSVSVDWSKEREELLRDLYRRRARRRARRRKSSFRRFLEINR